MKKISDFRTRLEEALSQRNMRAAQLSRDSGVNKATISQYLKGVYEPKREQLCRMAEVLGVTPEWLEGYDAAQTPDEPPELVCRIPVYGIGALDTPIRYEVCDPIYKDCFYVEADEHFYPAVNAGDLVMLEKYDTLENGHGALIAFRQYMGLYIFKLSSEGAELCCLNGYYPPVAVSSDELSEIKVFGRVILSIRKW